MIEHLTPSLFTISNELWIGEEYNGMIGYLYSYN